MSDNIFDSTYVEPEKTTKNISNGSNTKKFLKEPINPNDMEQYGSSKPKRILIKAKISNG